MNDLATIIKMNKPLAVKMARTAAHRANTMCSGRLPETEPKTARAKAFLRKHGRP